MNQLPNYRPKLCVVPNGRTILTASKPASINTASRIVNQPNKNAPIIRPKPSAKFIPPQTLIRHSQPAPRNAVRATSVKPKISLSTNNRKTGIQYITRETTKKSIESIKRIQGSKKGKILAIIGNGPSINEVPLDNLKDLPLLDIISINRPDFRIWPTTHWAFFDRSQEKRHQDLIQDYKGVMFNSTSINTTNPYSIQFKHLPGTGFSRDLTHGINIGRSSVFACMQIGLWMGYEHIFIFGCDMNAEGLNGKLHFYGQNPDVKPENRSGRFAKEAESYDFAANNLSPEERSKFTFCTEYNPFSFVHKFNLISHRVAVSQMIDQHNALQSMI